MNCNKVTEGILDIEASEYTVEMNERLRSHLRKCKKCQEEVETSHALRCMLINGTRQAITYSGVFRHEAKRSWIFELSKRTIDILVTLALILALSPVMALVAL